MTTTAAPHRITIEARIWGVSDTDMVKLYLGQRMNEGVRQYRTRIPLSDSNQAEWFHLTLEDDVIVGIAAI